MKLEIPNDSGHPYRLDKFVEYQHNVPSIHYRTLGQYILKRNLSPQIWTIQKFTGFALKRWRNLKKLDLQISVRHPEFRGLALRIFRFCLYTYRDKYGDKAYFRAHTFAMRSGGACYGDGKTCQRNCGLFR